MSVIITPSEQLEFHRPFTRISKESLIVKNPGPEPIVFKVKTTAPKQYCVRPNAGRIEPNSDIEVQIILQPFKEELPDDFKCKDKFLVQTAPIKEAIQHLDISSMWSQIETTDKSSMHQHKIKCVFLPPSQEEQQQQQEEEDKVASIPETAATAEPIASSSIPSEQEAEKLAPIVTEHKPTSPPPPPPSLVPSTSTTTSPPPPPPPRSLATEEKPIVTTTNTLNATTSEAPVITSTPPITTTTTTSTSTPVTKPAPVSPPPAVSSREIKPDTKETELKAALEKIALLEKQLSDLRREEGLRARNQTGTSNRKLASTVQPLDAVHQHLAALEKPRPTEGYPPQVLFGVAVLVFIITYLFF